MIMEADTEKPGAENTVADVKQNPLLKIENLEVDIPTANGTLHAVRDVSLTLNRGEALGIVGESGSGKSMSALALLGLLPAKAQRRASTLRLGRHDLLSMSDGEIAKKVSGDRITMIFQEPMTSLNPVYSIGRQLTETMTLHGKSSEAQARERAIYLLGKVGLSAAESRLAQYPHQLSGGQRQRVMIAMALMNEPELIIADEPTTALDVTVQAQILRLLGDLQREFNMAMILISHDLGVISRTVDKVAVMYAGQLIETGTVKEVLDQPRHPYTRGLLDCIPEPGKQKSARLGTIRGLVPSLIGETKGCAFANRCSMVRDDCLDQSPPLKVEEGEGSSPDHSSAFRSFRCVLPADWVSDQPRPAEETSNLVNLSLESGVGQQEAVPLIEAKGVSRRFSIRRSLFSRTETLTAVDDVSLSLSKGDVLALVGESGCGKSTLAKMLLGLDAPSNGEILFEGAPLSGINPLERTRRIQPVFQDPYSSLNPRKTIGEIIIRPLNVHNFGEVKDRQKEVERTMEMVGLPRRLFHSFPNQISGGQRQRVAIARAIIMRPEILICDEPTSALDVSVQAQILNLLQELRQELGLTYLLITHDLSVVEYMATKIAVMYLGQIVELAEKEKIFSDAAHPYTNVLLQSLLTMQPGQKIPDTGLGAVYSNPLDLPKGCRFHPRCPEAINECRLKEPELGSLYVRCLRHPLKSNDVTIKNETNFLEY